MMTHTKMWDILEVPGYEVEQIPSCGGMGLRTWTPQRKQ